MVIGVRILGAQLATCRDCGALRVTEDGREHWIRAVTTADRVTFAAPPCMRPPRRPLVW